MRLPGIAALVAAVLLPALPARAQEPLFHGVLSIKPALGGIDKEIGIGSLRVRTWDLCLVSDSNGIAPDREPVIIALGESERLVIPAGEVRASRNGRKFTYRNPNVSRGIRFFQVRQLKDDPLCGARYRVGFSLVGIDLSRLVVEFPICMSLAVIVGDDDGFSGIELTKAGRGLRAFETSRVRVLGACQAEAWPWV
jgi:hypothetical protein